MDWLTWGLVFVLIVFFTARWVIEYRIYKNSVYKVLYENFTEYRIRKKSIEGMSESNVIKKMFGSGRLVYQVLDQRNLNPASFVVMILPGGFQIFGIAGKNKVGRDALKICGKFYAENVEKKLAQSVYAGKNIPVSCRMVLSDQENAALPKNYVKRSGLLAEAKKTDEQNGKVLTAEDMEHIFRIIAKDALTEENDNRFGTILTKDK